MSEFMKFNDTLLIGFDSYLKSSEIILNAYNDVNGVTKKFIENVLLNIKKLYNFEFNEKYFEFSVKWNNKLKRVVMFLKCNQTLSIKSSMEEITLHENDNILVEFSHKFETNKIEKLSHHSNLIVRKIFITDDNYFMMGFFIKNVNTIWEKTDSLFKNIIGWI